MRNLFLQFFLTNPHFGVNVKEIFSKEVRQCWFCSIPGICLSPFTATIAGPGFHCRTLNSEGPNHIQKLDGSAGSGSPHCRIFYILIGLNRQVKRKRSTNLSQGITATECLLLPPSAVPHISQKNALGIFLTASPRGEKPLPDAQHLPFYRTSRRFLPKASPLREKLSENRLFGTDFLTDVGDAAQTGRHSSSRLC